MSILTNIDTCSLRSGYLQVSGRKNEDTMDYLNTSSHTSPPNIPNSPCLHLHASYSFPATLGADPSFWAPYTPLSSKEGSSKVRERSSQPSIVGDIFRQHNIPFNLCILDEIDQLAIAHAFEERAIWVCELDIAERRLKQQVVLARLDSLQAHDQLLELDQKLLEFNHVGKKKKLPHKGL